MRPLLSFLAMSLRARTRRIAWLAIFGLVFLAAGATARTFARDEHGHLEMDQLFVLGGTTLVSALLLLAWLIGRFPVIATLVLMYGMFSEDRATGVARLHAVRPRSLVLLYGARFVMLALVAFALCAVLLPLFDLLVLGEFSGTSVFALIGSQILIFGALCALFTVLIRADAWAALFLGVVGIVWDGLRRVDFMMGMPPLVRDIVSVVLPPQGALMRIEQAFGMAQPVPMDSFLYISLYAALVVLVAGVLLTRREL